MTRRTAAKLVGLFALMISLSACQTTPSATPTELIAAPSETATWTATPEPQDPTETPSQTPTEEPEATGTPTEPPTATATPFATGPEDFPPNVNPLTGLVVSDLALLDRHPVMVKVSNFPRSLRPHSGLSWADIVFEHYIGTGATRFNAIYYGQNPPESGPVRSARLIDAQIVNAYQAVFAFASADSVVYSRVTRAVGSRGISEGPATCPALCRVGTGDVNSVRAYPDLLAEFANEKNGVPIEAQELKGMRFDFAVPDSSSSQGMKATIQYASSTISEWSYDDVRHQYIRSIENVDIDGNVTIVPLVDALTRERLTADNVIIMFAETIELKPTLHDFTINENRQGQQALLFRDGRMYRMTWRSQGPNLPLQFLRPDGEVMAFKPGNTWVHIVGLSSNQTEITTGEWKIINFLP